MTFHLPNASGDLANAFFYWTEEVAEYAISPNFSLCAYAPAGSSFRIVLSSLNGVVDEVVDKESKVDWPLTRATLTALDGCVSVEAEDWG